MITGFNTNIRHRAKLYHVQTEDSGRSNPHVISHLYFGGTILASQKSDYAEHLGVENLDEQIRELMETQHKSMLKRLRAGDFDEQIAERLGGETAEGSTTSPAIDDEPALPPGKPAQPVPQPAQPVALAPERGAAPGRVFGDGIVSHKPLDELILEYLVEKARDRSGRSASPPTRPARDSRSRG